MRGVLHVKVDKATNCNDLDLAFVLITTSKHGTSRTTPTRKLRLFSSGDWLPGTYAYPFDFPVAGFPPTCKGKVVEFRWELTVAADLARARNVEVSVPLRIEIAPEDGLIVTHRNPGDPRLVGGKYGSAVSLGVILLIASSGLSTAGVALGDNALMGLGLGLVAILLLFAFIKWMRLRAIGAPQLVVEHLTRGDEPTLRCTLWLKSGVDPDGIEATFSVHEAHEIRWSSGSQENRSTYTYAVLEHAFPLLLEADGAYRGEISLAELAELVKPGALPFTFLVAHSISGIAWSIKVVIRRKGGVNYSTGAAVLWAMPARGVAAEAKTA